MSAASFLLLQTFLADKTPIDLHTEAEVAEKPWALLIVLGLIAAAIIVVLVKTKAGPIGKITFIETIRQPVVLLLVAVSAVLTVFSGMMPMFTLSYQDMKMVMDMGFSTAALCGLLVAFFSASATIGNEIEKKTALTVLSKPVSRVEFICGKYLGIMGTVAVSMAVIAVFLWGTLAAKHWTEFYYLQRAVEMDAATEDPTTRAKNRNILVSQQAAVNFKIAATTTDTLKGTYLAILQVAALAAISVAVSTRLPMVVNVVLCMGIFVFGHLSAGLYARVVASRAGPIMTGFATVLVTVLPNLENLNLSWRIAEGTPVSPSYMLISVGYVAIYVVAALYVAVFSLSRRELS